MDMNRGALLGRNAMILFAGLLTETAWTSPPDESAALSALDEKVAGVAAHFVAMPPGAFEMGTPEGAVPRGDNEVLHTVAITRGFEMQATEVTQLQYALVMGENPSRFKSSGDCEAGRHRVVMGVEVCADNPVENVSWEDAQIFIDKLNAAQDKYRYRLPTEAEWEYAARPAAWTLENSGNKPHPVASPTPNAFGLYDMLGNVWEWTRDLFGPYPHGTVFDPQGAATGSCRAVRGGGWTGTSVGARAAQRTCVEEKGRYVDLGFRLVRDAR